MFMFQSKVEELVIIGLQVTLRERNSLMKYLILLKGKQKDLTVLRLVIIFYN